MVVCILNGRHPHPGIPGREYSIVYREYAAAFLSRRHLPSGIGCHTVAQTPKLDPAKKTPKIGHGQKKHQDWSQRLGSGFVEALFISSHMVQLSDHQHDLNVCQQWRGTFIG